MRTGELVKADSYILGSSHADFAGWALKSNLQLRMESEISVLGTRSHGSSCLCLGWA